MERARRLARAEEGAAGWYLLVVLLLWIALAAADNPTPTPPPVAPREPARNAMDYVPMAGAALLAAVLTRIFSVRRRSRPPAVVRIGRAVGFRPFGAGLPGVGDGSSVWVTPDPTLLAESLAARLAIRGPVLLLPHPEARDSAWSRLGAGALSVWMPEEERPSARRALDAATSLGADGRVVALVVRGAGALESAPGGRPTAALEELLRCTTLPVFVVVGDDEPTPSGRLTVVTARPAEAPGTWSAEGVALRLRGGLLERA